MCDSDESLKARGVWEPRTPGFHWLVRQFLQIRRQSSCRRKPPREAGRDQVWTWGSWGGEGTSAGAPGGRDAHLEVGLRVGAPTEEHGLPLIFRQAGKRAFL